MSFNTLPTLEVHTAANQLTSCVYVSMRCSNCGELRLALAMLPESGEVKCPLCSKVCSFTLLGSGLTKRQLPFYESPPAERIRWTMRDPELLPVPGPPHSTHKQQSNTGY